MSARPKSAPRAGTIKAINTPLGFYVLALLIVEAALALVLTQIDPARRFEGFLWMTGIFIGLVVIVTLLVIFNPKNLLYGKEEYSAPQIDPSALRDQIEDLIAQNVKPECLKKSP